MIRKNNNVVVHSCLVRLYPLGIHVLRKKAKEFAQKNPFGCKECCTILPDGHSLLVPCNPMSVTCTSQALLCFDVTHIICCHKSHVLWRACIEGFCEMNYI